MYISRVKPAFQTPPVFVPRNLTLGGWESLFSTVLPSLLSTGVSVYGNIAQNKAQSDQLKAQTAIVKAQIEASKTPVASVPVAYTRGNTLTGSFPSNSVLLIGGAALAALLLIVLVARK